MRRNEQIILIVLLFVFIYLLSLNPGGLDITDEYISLLPSVLLLVASLYGAKNTSGLYGVLAMFMVGVSLALVAGELNTLNVIIPDWLLNHTITLEYLQAGVILLSTVVGIAFKG